MEHLPSQPQATDQPPVVPALDYLGCSLDMTSLTAISIETISRALIGHHIQTILPSTNLRSVPIGNVTYSVPTNIAIAQDTQASQQDFIAFHDGPEAIRALQNVPGMSSYLVVSGNNLQYQANKAFRNENQYACYRFGQGMYTARFKNYGSSINTSLLKENAKSLPIPFSSEDAATLETYHSFFRSMGTHVVTGANYGMSFQVLAWASNKESQTVDNFSSNIKAYFNGVVSQGQFDASVKETAQYGHFSDATQKLVSVKGGDAHLRGLLTRDPTDYNQYVAWSENTTDVSEAISFETKEIWTLMSLADDDSVVNAATSVQAAYNYIIAHPQTHTTPIIFSIDSTWAEVGLLSPDAVIQSHPDFGIPASALLNEGKLKWSAKNDGTWETLVFQIVNDGSPVDFYIAHGLDGTVKGGGRASVTIHNKTYVNDKLTSTDSDTERFYLTPV